MKKNSLILILMVLTSVIFAQSRDTTVKSSWYARTMPVSLYTGSGIMTDRISQNVEFGRSIGVIDVGLAYGKINLRPDSSNYLEAKVTMDACQYGIFSNEFTVGFGGVLKSKTPIMLEVSSTIFAQVNKYWGFGIVTGYYDFSGETHDVGKNYFGLYLRFGLQRSDGGMLMNRKVHLHHHR